MASQEDHIPEEDHEDIDSDELFASFMEITKDAEQLESKANGADSSETGAIDDKNEEGCTTNATVDEKQDGTDCITVPNEKQNVTKRLSKAVDELSDLEQQLSMMISAGPGNSPTSKTIDQGTDNVSAVSSDTTQGDHLEKVASWGGTEGDTSNSGDQSQALDEKNVENNSSCSPPDTTATTDDSSTNKDNDNVYRPENVSSEGDLEIKTSNISENQTASSEVCTESKVNTADEHAMVIQVDSNTHDDQNQSNEDVTKKGLESNDIKNDVDTKANDEDDQEPVVSDSNQYEKTIENSNEGSENSSELSLTLTETQNQPQHDEIKQNGDNEAVVETSQDDDDSSTEQPQSKDDDTKQNDEAVRETSDDTPKETTSVNDEEPQSDKEDGSSLVTAQTNDNSNEEVDNDVTLTDSSAAEIEILMTDESGISERKSLESLDVDLENEMRPDSPGLSDEGIDSDARSLDDLDDEDTFERGSASDISLTNKLDVDRNRFGSNSSTNSEKEFRKSVKGKQDSDDPAKVHMKGHLLKLGGSGLTPRNWRKRWFALKEDNCLYYYKHSKDKVPCGVIVLCNYSITKAPDSSKKYCFKLNKGGARTYHFCAANDDDMREWMVALMKAASAISATGSSFQILEGNVHNVSIPALSIKDPECHGYLSKRGHGIKSWKRRYCVLKNGYLYYYTEMSNTTALGVAKLLGYQIQCGESRGKHFCFYGSPPDESMRMYHFAADTENDRERWMRRMEESIDRGKAT